MINLGTTTAATGTTGTSRTTTTTTTEPVFEKTNPGGILDKDDFLKLFVAQMQHQDPTKPMDDSAMMGQMASFSTLEQMSNMAAGQAQVGATLAQGQAINLIGKTITWADEAGVTHSGRVDKVTTVGGASVLNVGGTTVEPAWITEVA